MWNVKTIAIDKIVKTYWSVHKTGMTYTPDYYYKEEDTVCIRFTFDGTCKILMEKLKEKNEII